MSNDTDVEIRRIGAILQRIGRIFCNRELREDVAQTSRAQYRKGQPVELRGIQTEPDLNGASGTVEIPFPPFDGSTNESDRVCVRLDSSARLVSIRFQNVRAKLRRVERGYVLVHSLKNHPQLNGTSGCLIKSLPEKNRCIIEFSDGSTKSVPAHCTIPLACHNEAAVSQGPLRNAPSSFCCICQTETTTMTAADPCGHVCVCRACSFAFSKDAPCPLCRAPVDKYITLI